MRRIASLAACAVSACALYPSPDKQHFYACTTDSDCTVAGQVCVAGECGPPAISDAGDAGPPDAGDAGDAGSPDAGPDAGDAGPAFQDAGNATLTVALVSGGNLGSLTSGMDDGDIYATGRSIWRLAPGSSAGASFTDHGDALADAVEQGQLDRVGFRPLMYGEVGGDQFAAVARHDVSTGSDDVGIYVNPLTGKWRQLASFPILRNWALIDDHNLGPLVYAQVTVDGGNELIEIDGDGGQLNLVPPPDAGWACSTLAGAPDSGTLYVGLSDQGSLQTTALAIDNVGGVPTIDLQLPLGAIPMPNPGGCRQIGPTGWAEFRGGGGFHSSDLLFWDGTYGLGTLESIDLISSGTSDPIEAFDGGAPLSLTVATDLDFVVAGEGNLLYGQSLTGGQRFTPGPFVNELPDPISFLASSSQQVLAETSTGLYDVTTLAAIDGGGLPVLADTGLNGQVPFGYASGPHALLAFAGSDRSYPSLVQDNGEGFVPFAAPIGQGCSSQTPIDDNDTLVVCDGGTTFLVNNKVTPMGTAPGLLLAQDAPDGGIWLYAQTSPVQVANLDGGYSPISGTQAPVWGSPLGGLFEETYAYANTGGIVLLNGPKKSPTPLGSLPFSGAGVVDPELGNVFVGADSQSVVWACVVNFLPASVSCSKLCLAADPVVELQFQVVTPVLEVPGLGILSRESLGGTDIVESPPGMSHLAYVNATDLGLAGKLGDPPPACPLVNLDFPDPNAPEALLGIAAAPFPKLGSIGSLYLQGSRHLMTLSR